MIGSLGDVVFEVSSEKVQTFTIHGRKGLLEFTGLSAASISLNIRLDAGLGVIPKDELDYLHFVLKSHYAVPLILDGEPQGDGLWVLESIDEKHEIIDNYGTSIAVEVSLKLKEYIEI